MASWLRKERGFTLVEVIIALVLIVSVITGISMMLLAGSGAVARGELESQAAELAQRKIEEVKSLQYYSPWTGSNKDIDDFYWAFDGNSPRSNAAQLDHPVVEEYGSIDKRSRFKRTTAVQYQDVVNGALSVASMNANWIPKSMTDNMVAAPNFDLPKDSGNQKIRALVVEVRVYFKPNDSGSERVYVARGLVGDLMVTGGANNPVMVIKSIEPIEGALHDTFMQMDITIQSDGLQEDYNAGTAKVTAALWYEGQTDIPCKEYEAGGSVQVLNNGTLLRCHFNLEDHSYYDSDEKMTKNVVVRPGVYSLAVYWKNRGWKDASFRNCFTVVAPSPTITGLTGYKWGHRGQTARPLVLTGTNLWNATIRLSKDGKKVNGNITSNTDKEIRANFNLSTITEEDQYWDVEVTTLGGTVASGNNDTRLYVNPKSVITAVSATSAPNYYRWAHSGQTARKIRIEGDYLYGYEDAIADNEKWISYSSYKTAGEAVLISGPTGDEPSPLGQSLVLQYNPSSAGAGWSCADTYWTVHLKNYGGTVETSTNATKVLFNPKPTITSIQATSVGNYYDWAHSGLASRVIRVNGNYLYAFDATGAEVKMKTQDGGYSTADAAIASTQYTLNNEANSNWHRFTFNPSSAGSGSYFTTPNSLWNICLKNYGGSVASDADNKRVLMNPTPTITAVTPTSSPNYYDWAYRAQTARNVRIEGTYLYGLGLSGAESKLTYGGYSTAGGAVTTDPGADYARGAPVAAVVRFNPSSAGAGAATNNTRWNARAKNYGGTADSDASYSDASRTVWMNPPPVITGWSGVPNPGKTGTASGKADKTYAGIEVTGSYLQDGGTVYLTRNAAGQPVSGQVYMNLNQGASPAVSADGTAISGLNMRMHVSPVDDSFMKWNGGTPDNNVIAGTYFLYYVNADGQDSAPGSYSTEITHASYTINVSAKQPGSGSVSGGGTAYQDGNVTVTATPATTSPAGGCEFINWQSNGWSPGGTSASDSSSWTLPATRNITYYAGC